MKNNNIQDKILPSEEEIRRPGGLDLMRDVEKYARAVLEEEYGHAIASFHIDFDMRRIYISNIIWEDTETEEDQ